MQAGVAKALYEKITSFEGFAHSSQIEPTVPNRERLLTDVVAALGDCQRSADGRLYYAPSPWHAFFLLWERLMNARGRKSTVLYRGHNVVGLPRVGASLYRQDMTPESTRQARLAVDILAYMFETKEILKMKEDDPILLARTIAQHYGIRTSLLDVTLDPSVAVFFASTGGQGDAGAVFVFEWEHCKAVGIQVILPPVSPWSTRLTIQRGLFLEFEFIRDMDVLDVPFEIRFTRMPGFEVRRAGATFVPWPIDEPAATELVAWVKSAAERNAAIFPSVAAEIEQRAKTRVLLRQQFELMFGFPPDASLPPNVARQRVTKALHEYSVEAFAALEVYIHHLCLQDGFFAADRLLYLRDSNRSIFELYLAGICRLRQAGQLREPHIEQFLGILNHTCA